MRAGRFRFMAAALAVLSLAASPPAAAAADDPPAEAGLRVQFSLVAPPLTAGPGPLAPEWGRPGPSAALLSPVWESPSQAAAAGRRPRANTSRAWAEWAGFLSIITVQYWTSGAFPEDADYGLNLDDQILRIPFMDGVRFDSNQFSLNWSHILGGGLYYQFGRTNRTSWLYAYMMSIAGSTWWEIIGEPKEVISINDQIITGLGGFAVGEPWYQIGNYLLHQHAFPERALAVLNPVLLINHWIDRRHPATEEYIQPGWHDFSLFVGARRLSAAGTAMGTDLYLGFEAKLIGLPEYGRPGEVRRSLKDTYVAEMAFDYATQGGHAEETRWFTKAVPWGLFDQKIGEDGRGYSLMLGLGAAFELFKKRPLADYDANPVPVNSGLENLHLEEPRNFTDKLAILHIVGPVLDLTTFGRGVKLRTVLEGYFDFALVNATAINDYSVDHPITGLTTTVFYYGYHYAFGGTGAASFRLDYKGFELRGRAELGTWGSANFRPRFPDQITNNAHLADTRILYRGGIGWKVPGIPLKVFADLERVRRWGRLEEVQSVRVETKAYTGLAFMF
jgi:hypothetical protein